VWHRKCRMWRPQQLRVTSRARHGTTATQQATQHDANRRRQPSNTPLPMFTTTTRDTCAGPCKGPHHATPAFPTPIPHVHHHNKGHMRRPLQGTPPRHAPFQNVHTGQDHLVGADGPAGAALVLGTPRDATATAEDRPGAGGTHGGAGAADAGALGALELAPAPAPAPAPVPSPAPAASSSGSSSP
jgi:hypothetical protein